MWIFRIRSEVTNFCSTELKNWTREPKRWEGLGKGMIAVLAKLPMRNVSKVSANYTEYIYHIYMFLDLQNCQPEFVRLFASAPSDL